MYLKNVMKFEKSYIYASPKYGILPMQHIYICNVLKLDIYDKTKLHVS